MHNNKLKKHEELINQRIDFHVNQPLSTEISHEDLQVYVVPDQKKRKAKRKVYINYDIPTPIISENKIDFYNKP